MDVGRRATDWVVSTATGLTARYKKLGFYGKAAVWGWVALHFIVGAFVYLVTPARIFGCEQLARPLEILEEEADPAML